MINTMKKHTLYLIHLCSSHIKFPFIKKILIGPNFNWFQFNHSIVTVLALAKGFQPIFLKRDEHLGETVDAFTLEPAQITESCYKGINLFEVTKYQICVELQTFINDLEFSEPTHLRVIEKWFRKATSFIDYVLPYFQRTRFAKAIILQGYLYDHAIIRWICIERGVEVVAVENTFNKDKIIWDNVSGLSVNKNLTKNYFWRYAAIVDKKETEHYTKNFVANIKSCKQEEHKSPDTEIRFSKQGKTIFYIGQVYSDSSTLFGINDFHSPVSIIRELVNYSLKKKCTLIIKLHPKEIDGYDICHAKYNSLTHRKIKADVSLYTLIQKNRNIVYDYENRFDTYSIIRDADICVTINSQAGLESMLLGKRVVTCGNAFYDCLSSVYPAKNIVVLTGLLNYLLENEPGNIDMDEINTFFYIFSEKYCIDKDEKSFVTLLEKI